MKNLIGLLKKLFESYINVQPKPVGIHLKANRIVSIIKQAQEQNLAIHAIYGDKSFTGDLVKYDKENGRLILKNFQQNLSTIINMDEISRLSLVPPTVRKSQIQSPLQK